MTAAPVLVLEGPKNRIRIYEDRVEKTFHSGRYIARKARREAAALRALAGLPGVPAILELSRDKRSLIMSRLHGTPLSECESVAEGTLVSLRELVEQVLQRGVARHSLPARDVIVQPDGSAGLVDFERSTRRLFPMEPSWLLARAITRFQLLRLVHEFAPQLLTARERRRLRWQISVRDALQPSLKLKRRLVRRIRATWTAS